MSRSITISDDLYAKLEAAAQRRGLPKVEELLEQWQVADTELAQRAQVVQRIHSLQAHMFATYGKMPDSVDLIREDRDR